MRTTSTQGGSFIAPSGGVGGAAGVIEDAEGQLMWSESFGKATRSVPCPQVLIAVASKLYCFVCNFRSYSQKYYLMIIYSFLRHLASILM